MNHLISLDKSSPFRRPAVLSAVFGGLFVIGSILLGTHSLLALFSLEGLVVVIGGVIAVAYMSYDHADVQKALAAISALFCENEKQPDDLQNDIRRFVEWARLFRENEMLYVEEKLAQNPPKDNFVKYGLNMVVSEYGADDVRAMMETAADAAQMRESTPADILDGMASHAPAFGMIGTLLGMVTMLSRLDGDNIAALGASLSIAFLSTLYGVLSARMVYMPAATKFRRTIDRQRFRHQLFVEGMTLLAQRKQPTFMRDALNSFLRADSYNYYNVLHAAMNEPLPKGPRLKPVAI